MFHIRQTEDIREIKLRTIFFLLFAKTFPSVVTCSLPYQPIRYYRKEK